MALLDKLVTGLKTACAEHQAEQQAAHRDAIIRGLGFEPSLRGGPGASGGGGNWYGPPLPKITLGTLSLSASSFNAGAAQGTLMRVILGGTPGSGFLITDTHGGAVQLSVTVPNGLEVGPSPPLVAGTFSIQITEMYLNATNATIVGLTENAGGTQSSALPLGIP